MLVQEHALHDGYEHIEGPVGPDDRLVRRGVQHIVLRVEVLRVEEAVTGAERGG